MKKKDFQGDNLFNHKVKCQWEEWLRITVVFRFKHVRFKQDFTFPKMKE